MPSSARRLPPWCEFRRVDPGIDPYDAVSALRLHSQREESYLKAKGLLLTAVSIGIMFGMVLGLRLYQRYERAAEAQRLYAAGEFEAAKLLYLALQDGQGAAACDAQLLEQHYQDARQMLAAGDYEGAGKLLVTLGDYKDARALLRDYDFQRAGALAAAGKPEEAIDAYNKAIDLNPKNTDLIRNLGDTYADAENFVKAAEYYQRLVDMGKDYYKSNDFFTLSNYYLGIASTDGLDAATKADALAKSQKYIDEVDQLVPNNVQIVNQKAKIAKFREGDNNTGAALSAYNELLSILETKENKQDYARYYKYAYNYLATYYFTKGDKATAKGYYQKWLEYDPENESLRNYVNSLK